jgi:UDP-glucose 4-epimerase
MREKAVLVTGGAGFIGSHVVDELLRLGKKVVVLDDLSGGKRENVNPRATFVEASITDAATVKRVFDTYDLEVVYHLAAYAAEGLSHFIRRYNYENNLIGSVTILNEIVSHKVPKIVFTSSMAVYGHQEPPFSEETPRQPEDPYGIAKAAFEQDLEIAHTFWGLKYVIIRPHNVYGPRQNIADAYRNVIGIFMNRIMHGQAPTIYGDGLQTRAFSYIDDVAPVIARAGYTKEAEGQIINVGAAEPYTVKELAEMTAKVMGVDIKPVHLPPRKEVKHAHCTIEKSVRLLGYKTSVTLEEGLHRMAAWAKSVGPQAQQTWDSYEVVENIPPYWLDLLRKDA